MNKILEKMTKYLGIKDRQKRAIDFLNRLFIGKQLYSLISDDSLCKVWRN